MDLRPNYANWNNNEPNNQGDEDYAHITDSSIGRPGAWNDLGIAGGGGLYQAKGYIVEYGTSTDLPLNIVANTSNLSSRNFNYYRGGLFVIQLLQPFRLLQVKELFLWFDCCNGR